MSESSVNSEEVYKRNFNSDWRLARPGRTPKLAYILETNQFADATFRLGNASNYETITAHRFVLSMYSSVFEAMFQGQLAAPSEEIIELPDIEPIPFKCLLKFVYTGEYDKELAVSDALGVLYAAKKYIITDLELVCTDQLKNRVTVDNAVSIFQTAQLLDVNDLREDLHSFILRNFDNISKTEDFLSITNDNLKMFLQDDETRGSELDIFVAAMKWALSECSRQGLDITPSNQRLVLNDVLELIRFPIMTTEDFAKEVVPTKVLTAEESTLLFQHMVVSPEFRNVLPELTFNRKKRSCSTYIARFYEGMATSAYVDISAGWFNKFSVDQPISIVSFGFYGPHSAEAATYEITVKLTKDSSDGLMAEVPKTSVVVKMKEIFHIKFPKAVPILPGNNYRAWFSLKGPLTCHGISLTSLQEVIVPVNFSRYKQVKFTYNVTGAHQLPEIAFQI